MATLKRHPFHTVSSEVDQDDLDAKIKKHRRKVFVIIASIILLVLIALIAIYIYFEHKTYTSYEVINSIERSDTSASQFETFQGNLLKYTNDGAVYTDLNGNRIWNQTYEMDHPSTDSCNEYLVIYELNGTQIYILNKVSLQSSIQTTMPIQRVSVAKQGTIAVLMESEGISYLQLYDKEGTQLAAGELHVQNSGYPLDIALSEDGQKLAVAMLDINEGSVKTTIAFYNFGAVGQNSIDKIVGSYSYPDMLISRIHYMKDDTMVAFGDSKVVIFRGTQKPAESTSIEITEEVKSIFYDDQYFGLVFDSDSKEQPHRLELYNIKGAKVREVGISIDYNQIELLDNQDICIYNDNQCEIINRKGIRKLLCTFDKSLYKVISTAAQRNYTFILEGETRRVKLK